MSLTRQVSNTGLYNNDKWLIAKYRTKCDCGNMILPGENLWYVPSLKKAYCSACGTKSYPEELIDILQPFEPNPKLT